MPRYTEETLPNQATRIIHWMLASCEIRETWIQQALGSPKPVILLGMLIKNWVAEFLPRTENVHANALLDLAREQANYYELAAFWLQDRIDLNLPPDSLPKPDRDHLGRLNQPEPEPKAPEPAPEPELPDWIKRQIEEGYFFLSLEIATSAAEYSFDDRNVGTFYEARIIANLAPEAAELTEADLEEDVPDELEIGWIHAYRVQGSNPSDILAWAYSIGEEVSEAFRWLVNDQFRLDEEVLYNPVLFVEEIKIDPAWRGRDLGLRAMATFCDILADGCVFWSAKPLDSSSMSRAEQREAFAKLKQHWAKLGLTRHSKQGYVYALDWVCPKEFRGKEYEYQYADE